MQQQYIAREVFVSYWQIDIYKCMFCTFMAHATIWSAHIYAARRVCVHRETLLLFSFAASFSFSSMCACSLLENDAFSHTQARLSAARPLCIPRRVFAPSRLLLAHNSLQIFIVRRPSAFLGEKCAAFVSSRRDERDETRTPLQVMATQPRMCLVNSVTK